MDKDFLGKEIGIGDIVVAAVDHGRNSGASLVKFTVTGITDKFVKGEIPAATNYLPKKLRVAKTKCVVVGSLGLEE